MSTAARDDTIRDLYLKAASGPLRVALGAGGYAPWLRAGDVVLLDRLGLGAARPGEFIGLRDPHGEVRLLRLLERRGDSVRLLAPERLEEMAADAVVGRATHVVRGDREVPLDTARSPSALLVDRMRTSLRSARRRVRVTADRCPVGCRFCIYSCVATGNDMPVEIVRRAARAFRTAGIPRIRILGGEPFMAVPQLVAAFRAICEAYDPADVSVLTSAYYGTSAERVRAKMDPVVAAGLGNVHLSFDAFHLERYPVSCYERVLDYLNERDLVASLVVHYSDGLERELTTLLRLRERHPFGVRITTVSREGDAQLLKDSETSVLGFDAFRAGLLDAPGIELISEDRSCFRWTVFPNGDLHFCCKQNEDNRVGNLAEAEFPELQDRLRRLAHRNRMNIIRFASCPTDDASGNACLTCPLEAS